MRGEFIMKKTLITLTILVAIMVTSLTTFATEASNIRIFIDGEELEIPAEFGQAFLNADSRTMIPLRAVSEGLGFEVDWDGEAYAAIVKGSGKEIILPINESYGIVNGETVYFDTETVIKNSRTYLALRFVTEELGFEVDWEFDGINHLIDLISPENVVERPIDQELSKVDLTSDEGFLAFLDNYGVEGLNYETGLRGFKFNPKDLDNGYTNLRMGLYEGQIIYTFQFFSDEELNLMKESLNYLYGGSALEDVESLTTKLQSDIESTDNGKYYVTSTISGLAYKIGDWTVTYYDDDAEFHITLDY